MEEKKQKEYQAKVNRVTPKHSLAMQMAKAFLVGGIICVIGQVILNIGSNVGLTKENAGAWCSLVLIAISVVLTGFHSYQKIAKFGGAGAIVPITGFANSVASAAIEFKKEGQIFGVGCKIFTIAGPVILYGIFSSWLLGVVYYLLTIIGVIS